MARTKLTPAIRLTIICAAAGTAYRLAAEAALARLTKIWASVVTPEEIELLAQMSEEDWIEHIQALAEE